MSVGTPQHMAALRAANVVRLARADVRREVRDRVLPLRAALLDPRTVGELTDRQRAAVLDSLPEYVRREEGLGKLLEGTR